MKITPTHDRILLRRDKKETTSSGGVILTPETTGSAKVKTATVEAIGDAVEITLSVGDRVMVSNFSGEGVDPDDKELCMVRQIEVIAVLTGADDE